MGVLVRLQQQLPHPLSATACLVAVCVHGMGKPICTMDSNNLTSTNQKIHLKGQDRKMNRFKNRLNRMRTTRKAIKSRGSLIGAALALTACLATPLRAATFFFETGSPNGLLGALSRRPSPGKAETETADDFVLQETTVLTQATIFGLIPTGTPLENIRDVEVEVYHVFSLDSDVERTSGPPVFSTARVPTRNNSPSDVEIDTATRARTAGTLTASAQVLDASFTVGTTVVNGTNVT